MRIAIVKSSYIPWKGYFDLIGSVDEFVLLDAHPNELALAETHCDPPPSRR